MFNILIFFYLSELFKTVCQCSTEKRVKVLGEQRGRRGIFQIYYHDVKEFQHLFKKQNKSTDDKCSFPEKNKYPWLQFYPCLPGSKPALVTAALQVSSMWPCQLLWFRDTIREPSKYMCLGEWGGGKVLIWHWVRGWSIENEPCGIGWILNSIFLVLKILAIFFKIGQTSVLVFSIPQPQSHSCASLAPGFRILIMPKTPLPKPVKNPVACHQASTRAHTDGSIPNISSLSPLQFVGSSETYS